MAPSALQLDPYQSLSISNPIKPVECGDIADYGAGNTQRLIGQALQKHVEQVDHDTCEAGEEDAFFVADLGEVYRQHMRWKLHLPRVTPHYGE
jgi:ornithine decarboxylase